MFIIPVQCGTTCPMWDMWWFLLCLTMKILIHSYFYSHLLCLEILNLRFLINAFSDKFRPYYCLPKLGKTYKWNDSLPRENIEIGFEQFQCILLQITWPQWTDGLLPKDISLLSMFFTFMPIILEKCGYAVSQSVIMTNKYKSKYKSVQNSQLTLQKY